MTDDILTIEEVAKYLRVSDRTVYGGEFVDGLYTGRGTMIHGDGTIETGLWEENNLVGD